MKICSVQSPASSASHHTSFLYIGIQNKPYSKVRYKLDLLSSEGIEACAYSRCSYIAEVPKPGTEQGGTFPTVLSCSTCLLLTLSESTMKLVWEAAAG